MRARPARARHDPWRRSPAVGGAALRNLVATIAADARLVTVTANRHPWTRTAPVVIADEDVTCLWRVDDLPSRLAGDTTLTHDYLSEALEFDDGCDRTRYWSSNQPEVQLRLSVAALAPPRDTRGRPLRDGRARSMARPATGGTRRPPRRGAAPSRVVRAWPISCTFPQAGRAAGELRRIELVERKRTVKVP